MPSIRISMETIEDPPTEKCLDTLRAAAKAEGWDCIEAAHVTRHPRTSVHERVGYTLAYADIYRDRCPDADVCAYINCFFLRQHEELYKYVLFGLAGKSKPLALVSYVEEKAPGSIKADIKKLVDFFTKNYPKSVLRRNEEITKEYLAPIMIVSKGLDAAFNDPSFSGRH